jgi:hypothetical protein
MNESLVYFILDTYSNSVKIGYTTIKGLKKRLETLQIGTPYELKLLGATWGDKKVEKTIHKRFYSSHIRGEWFHYTKELEDFISETWDFSVIESIENKLYQKFINKPKEINYGK